MKQPNNNKIWLITINIIIGTLLLLLIVSVVVAIKETDFHSIKLSKDSFNKLISEFEGSIKIIAGIIAILTIKVYFLNMKRTDAIIERTNRQVNAYVKNENLKNYFLHRKEFREYFSEIDLFKNPKNNQNLNFYAIWDTVYRAFYHFGYKNFEPTLNENAKKSVIAFFNAIKNSPINFQETPNIDQKELNKIENTIIISIKPIIEQIRENKLSEIKFKTEAEGLIPIIFTIKIIQELYESVLSFDGENITHEYFKFNENIEEYIQINKES